MESHKSNETEHASRSGDGHEERRSHGMRNVPRNFVVRSEAESSTPASGRIEHHGAALDERSFESLQRIARYLRLGDVSNCSRAELLERIRAELAW